MVRNLDHRIEVACPILDPKLKAEIYEIIFIQLNDNQKARILDYHLKNAYYHPPLSLAVRSQNEIFDFLSSKNKASYLKVTASDWILLSTAALWEGILDSSKLKDYSYRKYGVQ